VLDCVLATFHLHVNSRVASLCGEGFYTIGPCGEESLAAIGPALQQRDSVALHYRHLAVSLHRNWLHRDASLSPGSLAGCLLDRARGYTVSSLDPVSGGNHCALGGAPNDFLVTSTLASQCPPAVGRALGSSLAHSLGLAEAAFEKRAVHFVTLGDGSTANGHFLSSLNLAAYAQHRSFKCPLVFGVSDNQISISLRNYGYLSSFLSHCPIKLFEADGSCIHDVHAATKAATDYSRRTSKPSLVHYKNISRRCPTRPLSLVPRPPPLTKNVNNAPQVRARRHRPAGRVPVPGGDRGRGRRGQRGARVRRGGRDRRRRLRVRRERAGGGEGWGGGGGGRGKSDARRAGSRARARAGGSELAPTAWFFRVCFRSRDRRYQPASRVLRSR
jgi:2-oxoisovalerate dehydrogenase E1 component